MEPKKIGTVEVVNVFKTKVLPVKSYPGAPEEEPRMVTGSRLVFLQDDPNDNWAVRGELTIPGALTFGGVYDVMLVKHVEKPLLTGEARKFQEEEAEPL